MGASCDLRIFASLSSSAWHGGEYFVSPPPPQYIVLILSTPGFIS